MCRNVAQQTACRPPPCWETLLQSDLSRGGESSSSRMPAQGVKRPSMFFHRKHQHTICVISADTLKLPVWLARSQGLIMNISPHCCYLLIRMELQWQLSDIRIKKKNVSTQNCLGGRGWRFCTQYRSKCYIKPESDEMPWVITRESASVGVLLPNGKK